VREIAILLPSRYRFAAFDDRCCPLETKVGTIPGLITAQLVAILHHEGIKVASNLAKTRLQVELKEHVCRLAIKPAGIRFEKRIDVSACPITGIACDRVGPYHTHALV